MIEGNAHYDNRPPKVNLEIKEESKPFVPSAKDCSPCFYKTDLGLRPFCRRFDPPASIAEMDKCPLGEPFVQVGAFLVPISTEKQILSFRERRWENPYKRR